MATTQYFNKIIVDQSDKNSMEVELGRSSYYAGCDIKSGTGEDSIYLSVDGKLVIMDRKTAKEFVEAVQSVGRYHGLIE